VEGGNTRKIVGGSRNCCTNQDLKQAAETPFVKKRRGRPGEDKGKGTESKTKNPREVSRFHLQRPSATACPRAHQLLEEKKVGRLCPEVRPESRERAKRKNRENGFLHP